MPWWATTITSPRSPAKTFRCSSRTCPAKTRRASTRPASRPTSAAGNLPDDQSVVGLQRPRHPLQDRRADHPRPGRGRGPRRQPALERRPAPRRHDRPGIQPSGCRTSASGSPPTASRSTAPAADRSRPSPGASRPSRRPAAGRLLARPQASGLDCLARDDRCLHAVPVRQDDSPQTGPAR